MHFSTLTIAAVAAAMYSTVTALPAPGTCVVDLRGTPYNQLALRPTPCTNGTPLAMLTGGQGLTVVSNHQQSGCGFTYTQVSYTAPNGQVLKGFVGSEFVNCNYGPAPAAQQLCGSWAVKHGGPNACGNGSEFNADDHTTCNQDGSNCQSVCCKSPIVY